MISKRLLFEVLKYQRFCAPVKQQIFSILNGRFSVENIPLYDSTDDEHTSIPKDTILAKDEPVTQENNSNMVHTTENPEIASSNEFTPLSVEPLTASSDELTPMTIEPLIAVPVGVDIMENGLTEYGAQYSDDTAQNSMHKVAKLENQSSPQNNNHHTELVLVRPTPKFRGGKAKRGLRKQLNVADICDRLASAAARQEILFCEVKTNSNSLVLKTAVESSKYCTVTALFLIQCRRK